MKPDDFPAFYQAVHGYEPFPWQTRLAREVADRGWPAVLDLPTAAGKTSAIDVAVFTLALQAGQPLDERTAPLRTFFVMDRRLVVDQAARHARQLKEAFERSDAAPLVREVARRLVGFGGPGPLHVAALRGGMYRDDSWARAPDQPTVCVTTVDQVGSRLLFRGYGLSEYRRPVHAGLAGNDALYLIDEAHLSQPFLETLEAVRKYRGLAGRRVGGPLQVVEMSATPFTPGERFGLLHEDRRHRVLRQRLQAAKPATLKEPDDFEAEAAAWAREVVKEAKARVVGVVVNRVASARRIFEELRAERHAAAVLLTGRIRPWDRERLLKTWLGRMQAGRRSGTEDGPLFAVATQSVEVGADLDFDYLITEAAPLAALRQRFGRLDRLGQFGHAAGAILRRKGREPDPVYGDELGTAWDWLKGLGQDTIDFGIEALDGLIRTAPDPPPRPAERHAPVLLPAHLDTWFQTSPTPQPDPDVAPFLHGWDALEAADVQVVWRGDLSGYYGKGPDTIQQEWIDAVASARPVVLEGLPIMVGVARDWLRRVVGGEVADMEGVVAGPAAAGKGMLRFALRWRGPDQSELVGPGDIRPGDTLVVPSDYGGADPFGWSPGRRQPVPDVGDPCFNLLADSAPADGQRKPIRLRLHPGLYRQLLPEPTTEDERQDNDRRAKEFTRTLAKVRRVMEEDEEGECREPLQHLLSAYRDAVGDEPLMAATIDCFRDGLDRSSWTLYPGGVLLLRRVAPGFSGSPQPLPAEASDGGDEATEDDASSLSRRVSLREHTEGVVRWAGRFAQGLDERLAGVLERAARFHDLGKADPRNQVMLYGGDPVAAAGGELLAKSGMDRENRPAFERAWRLSGLPRQFRHELVSVALLRKYRGELLEVLSEEERDLVEYLVGTHHGRGRPFAPVAEEREPEPVVVDWEGRRLSVSPDHQLGRLASGWTDLFWRLVRRYGGWGLAYLEAVLVLADQARSREEEQTA